MFTNPKIALTLVLILTLSACFVHWWTESGDLPELSAEVPSLPEEETEYLWELEHRSNLLGSLGFAEFKQALKLGDKARLAALLADDFRGESTETLETVLSSPGVSASRAESSGKRNSLSADAICQRLLDLRNLVGEFESSSIGIKRIGPLDRSESEGRWSVLCEMWLRGNEQGKRVELTALFQLELDRPSRQRFEEGGWLRRLAVLETAVAVSDRPMFKDVTSSSGLNTDALHDNWKSDTKINNPGGVYACDFNRDGRTDFLVTDANPVANALYEAGEGGRFTDVTNTIGLGRLKQTSLSRGNAIFVDLNNDGWLDLVHTEGAIWENKSGTRFEEVTSKSNLFEITQAGETELKSISTADYDKDGDLDLYVLRRNEMPTSWLESRGKGPGSVLCRNEGQWQFQDVTKSSGTHGHESLIFTTVWLDQNNDNWPDLAVINEFGDSFLYVNDQSGGFAFQDIDPDKEDFGSMGVDAGDVDNDGNIDLYVAGMYSKAGSRVIGNLPDTSYPKNIMDRLNSLIDGSELYRNLGEDGFVASGVADRVHNIGWSWGPTMSDFNNDGWLDIYAPSGYMSRDRNKPDG